MTGPNQATKVSKDKSLLRAFNLRVKLICAIDTASNARDDENGKVMGRISKLNNGYYRLTVWLPNKIYSPVPRIS